MPTDFKKSGRSRQDAAAISAFVVAVGLFSAVGIIFSHTNASRPLNLLGALINLQPGPAESVAEPINFVQNQPQILQLTSDLGGCFSSATSVDEGAQ